MTKKRHPLLNQAYSWVRLAAKARKAGQYKTAEFREQLAERKLSQYRERKTVKS